MVLVETGSVLASGVVAVVGVSSESLDAAEGRPAICALPVPLLLMLSTLRRVKVG